MARKDVAQVGWIYDLLLWTFSIPLDLFFREIHPRGSWKVPRRGPVIFVAAPHANQFVDPLILMRIIRTEAKRRIANLIAEKSMRRRFIGTCAALVGSVPVARALDSTKLGKGKIYLPDPIHDPTLVRGVGTQFDTQAEIGGLLVLPTINGSAANAEILEILGPEEIRLKKEFKGQDVMKQLTGRTDVSEDGKYMDGGGSETGDLTKDYEGIEYKTAPKVDQTKVYDEVFKRLEANGCVAIFPEGGSHDRTELLPLKAGVAIMALGSLAAHPDSGLKIVPCGMNYFHAHKFRSRAVIEFGNPIEVPTELVKLYQSGERREATRQLLETIYQALVAVTVTSPDYDTLMVIQAARRLYNPTGKKLPLPMIVELNRRLVKGYTHYKDDPRIASLRKSVNDYNKQLWLLGIRDHQVEYARFSIPKVIFTLIYRVLKLLTLTAATLPGLILFGPVFIASKVISIRKSRAALAASTVKLQGRDVMATWKVLVALAFAPLLYATYTILLTYWTYRNRVQGYMPTWVPLWLVVISGMIIFPMISFAALRFGEIGMDIFKSLRPFVLSLNPTSANTLVRLREKRAKLSAQVTELINTLGPEMFPDFDHARIVADPFRSGAIEEPTSPQTSYSRPRRSLSQHMPPLDIPPSTTPGATIKDEPSTPGNLPRNESFGNLGNIGLFASRPPSRNDTPAGGMQGGMKGLSTRGDKGGLDEVAKKIRGAMRERGIRRRKSDEWDGGSGSGTGTGTGTPGSEIEMRKNI